MSQAKRLGTRDRQLNYWPKKPWPQCVPEKAEALKVIRLGIPTPVLFRSASAALAADWTDEERARIEVVQDYLAIAWQVAAAAALKPAEASPVGAEPLRQHLTTARNNLSVLVKNSPEFQPLVNKAVVRVNGVLRAASPRLGWPTPPPMTGEVPVVLASSGTSPTGPTTATPAAARTATASTARVTAPPSNPARPPTPAAKPETPRPWWKKVFK